MLRVGTDCSGIEAPIQALQNLKIPHVHVFSSDIDKYVIQSIKANYDPQIIFGDKDGPYPEGDITKRKIEDVPDIDLYVAGFPCQPFSMAGERKGFNDKRGNVFFSCLEVIKVKKPKYFILENVRGLITHNKGMTFKTILHCLEEIDEYNVEWKLLNTRDYGIPQQRDRVYIIGSLKPFDIKWPQPIKMRNIHDYIDHTDNSHNPIRNDVVKAQTIENSPKESVFIDFAFKHYKHPQADKYAPCILADSRTWCVSKHRYANCKERLQLQGFPKDFKQVVSDTQFKKQIGNSMSVNVMGEIFKVILGA